MSRRLSKKAIITILFIVVLIFSLTVFTYSWYRNYVDTKGTTLTTGKMALQINGYSVDSAHNVTSISPIYVTKDIGDTATIDGGSVNINTWNKQYHAYYIIKNPDTGDTINADGAISVTLDSLVGDERLGGITVDIVEVDKGVITSEIKNLTDEQVKSIIKTNSQQGIPTDTETVSFSNLKNAYHEFSIPVGNYICIRVTYEMPNNLSDYSDIDLNVGVRFILSQEGGLPGATTGTEHYVYSYDDLLSALSKYRPYDKITFKKSVDFTGDFILNRPVTITLQNADLNIIGNFIIMYPYEGRFAINTERNGSIAVFKQDVEIFDEDGNLEGVIQTGGHMTVTAPLSQIEFTGKNSPLPESGDIYVEGDLSVTASSSHDDTVYKNGFIVNGANIYPITEQRGDTSGYKPMEIGDSTRVSVAKFTTIGNITSKSAVIEIENRGTIGSMDLHNMAYDGNFQNKFLGAYPQIFIDNYGTITNGYIPLPINWADKFEKNDDGTYEGNTRIVWNPGSSNMTTNTTVGFKSDGSRNPTRDDIEYILLESYVEKVDGHMDSIVVMYMANTGLYIPGTSTDIGSSLETLLKYYMGEQPATITPNSDDATDVEQSLLIESVDDLRYVKIICYSTEITSADYAYIRKMASLVTIDMSETSSTGLKTPNSAFSGLANLTTVVPSRMDTAWGTDIFKSTKVVEIKFPDCLTSITSTTLTNIKYVHTSSRYLANVFGSKPNRLVFVPDADTYALYNTSTYYGYVFYEATRYAFDTGDYFLRLDEGNKTAELATYRGSSLTSLALNATTQLNGESKFNFESITIDGQVYQINVFDAYSFYKFAFSGLTSSGVTLSNRLTIVERYAFGSVTGINTININGAPSIETNAFRAISVSGNIYVNGDANIASYSFYGCKANEIYIYGKSYVGDYAFYTSTARMVHAPKVMETGYAAFGKMSKLVIAYLPSLRKTNEPLLSCGVLLRVDIGIFEEGTKFGFGSTTMDYIFIHADETDAAKEYNYTLHYIRAYDSNDKALGGTNLNIYVPSKYKAMYDGYGWGWAFSLGTSQDRMDDVKEYYDPNDPYYDNGYLVPNMLYLDYNDGTAGILRYLKGSPLSTTDLFTIPKEDGSGNYEVTTILSYAYRSVTINRKELVIPDTVKTINSYAFYYGMSGVNYNVKTIGRLDLSNVETVAAHAFRYARITVIEGKELKTAGHYSFANNAELITANFPKLSRINTSDTDDKGNPRNGTCFRDCSSLRAVTLGPLDDYTLTKPLLFYNCSALETIIVDMTNKTTATKASSNLFTSTNYGPTVIVIGNDTYNLSRAFTTDSSFSNILVQGTTTRTGKINNYMKVETPRYIFELNAATTAILRKCTSIDLELDRYEVPHKVVPTNDTYTFLGKAFKVGALQDKSYEGEDAYKINNIAASAYRSVNFGFITFSTGPYVTNISTNEFCGVTVRLMEMPEVTSISKNAFLSNGAIKSLKAPKVQTIEESAFNGCTALKEIQLPAIKTIGKNAFYGATGIVSVALGENITTVGDNAFNGCTGLKELVILANRYVTLKANVFTGVTTANIAMLVKSPYLSQYVTAWGANMGSISPFENAYLEEETGITYYYSVSNNEATMTYIDIPTDFGKNVRLVIPSEIFTYVGVEGEEEPVRQKLYDVTGLTDSFLYAVENLLVVRTIVLPDMLKDVEPYITDFPYYLESLEIAESNQNYKTVEGVLYSKDGTRLLVYPDNKADISFTVPSEVSIIAQDAFNNCLFLKHVTINSPVVIMKGAFTTCRLLESITFTSTEPSVIAGTGTFTNCNKNFAIYVPEESIEAYKANVHLDTFARDSITAIPTPEEPEDEVTE